MRRAAIAMSAMICTTVVLIGSVSAGASAGFLDHALKVALWSAIATDRKQTAQWIDYTPADPLPITWELESEHGPRYTFRCECIYEGNRILAGQREKLGPYFDWWANAVEAAQVAEWSPLAKVGAALVAAGWLRVVAANNRSPESLAKELPGAGARYTGPTLNQYAVIEFRTRF